MVTSRIAIKAADLQRIGVSKPYSHQLIGGTRTPSMKLAARIRDALGVPMEAWGAHQETFAETAPTMTATPTAGAENSNVNVSGTERRA